MPTARFIVGGRVQGVCYRASAREQALALGVAGHAVNRRDGSVEVLACGEPAALDALERWLRQGPPAARVDTLSREDLPEQDLHGFHTA
ncbi:MULTISPECIES: acylphosphatase [Rhodanobacter]|uniref:acylphosphatase n=1 Tax=Rhodanobacter denitrificans TaxID=666685 RepID=M4NDY4_9GAMM|nr:MULTISPECIES: acylphosphatase [Rhodanobacter]AGG88107.1 acylphosphatase [Rhodanobacter denitrificans]KZC19819.1 acylphosphatase [Rhodanobacter denitrificans]UJM87262.1 acylphosphatase [Rhodanobacter denitrificans]UJM94753.1 acylphosphatase [Rhodanobacter denitrificans]UJM98283.1 acylphosphatase [Rhodanobacter denitrificans]